MLHSLFSGTVSGPKKAFGDLEAANMLAALTGYSYDHQRESERRVKSSVKSSELLFEASWQCETVLRDVPDVWLSALESSRCLFREERLIWNVAKKHGRGVPRSHWQPRLCHALRGHRMQWSQPL